MIGRRKFIAGLGSAAAWPLAARAQQGERVRRIGVLVGGNESDPFYKRRVSAFTQALAGLSWTVGRNARMDLRWAGDDINRIRAVAQELVRLQPDIILTGAISESSSSHLPPSEGSKPAKPVMFPPGWLRLGTMPLATASSPTTKTIGIVRVSRWRAAVAGAPIVAMMSGCRPTNSCATARIRLMSMPAQRTSIRTLRPSVQPKPANA